MNIPNVKCKDGNHHIFAEDFLFLSGIDFNSAPHRHERFALDLKWKYIRHHIWLFKSWAEKEKIDGISRFPPSKNRN